MNFPRENAYKWWFHPTCYENQDRGRGVLRSGLPTAFEEVKKTVERTINRMTEIMQMGTSRAADDINNDIFKLRFKSNMPGEGPPNQQPPLTVLDSFKSLQILNYDVIENQKDAHIRWYCDNDGGGRLTMVPDIEADPPPNSGRTSNKEYDDKENLIRHIGDNAGWCLDGAEPSDTMAYTDQRQAQDPENSGQNKDRVVIVLCDRFFQQNTFTTIGDMLGWDKAQYIDEIDKFRFTRSHQILHELFHAYPKRAPAEEEYGWEAPLRLSKEQAFMNPDSYTYYALATILADHGWCIPVDDQEFFQQGGIYEDPDRECDPNNDNAQKKSARSQGKNWREKREE